MEARACFWYTLEAACVWSPKNARQKKILRYPRMCLNFPSLGLSFAALQNLVSILPLFQMICLAPFGRVIKMNYCSGDHLHVVESNEELGRDMGGCKTYGGRKTYQRTRSPENFWTPPKELLVCSVVDSCTGKTEHWHLKGVESVPYEGGSKTPFWEGCHSWGFPPSLFSTPHGVLWEEGRGKLATTGKVERSRP